jgi:Ca2+-binding RTX toxin-like protein
VSWSFQTPAEAFGDTNPGEFFHYSATLADGAALPSWLTFDAPTHTFSGTAPQGADLALKVTATDLAGLEASSIFVISSDGADHAPVAAPIGKQDASENIVWRFAVSTGSFTDADSGDTLTYTASLSNGAPLPAWLAFDANTRTFSGTPPPGSSGALGLQVTATDAMGASGSAIFDLDVASPYQPPSGMTLVGTRSNDTITGGPGNDTLSGLAGNDNLDGAAGADTMIGGAGNDTFIVDNIGDIVTELAGQGTDTVLSSIDDTLPANVENLTLTGDADLTATGNGIANTITANSGNDTLIAGSGIARLIGGAGNDTFVINNAADVVRAQAGGNNTVLTSVSYVAPANVHNLTGTGSANIVLTGGTQPVVITGNAGNDTLKAGSGIATLVGGSGSTTFVVNNVADVVIEHAGSGLAIVQSSVSYTAPDNVQDLFLTGSKSITATGNAHGGTNLIVGNAAADTLIGGTGIAVLEAGIGATTIIASAAAVMMGNKSADTITAGAGPVFIDAGAGADVINLGGANSVIAFNKGDGSDTIVAGAAMGNVLSLGGGIVESNLAFAKSGSNLVLTLGGSDKIVLQNWYAAGAVHDVSTLQVIEQAGIETFDFTQLVAMFDQARTQNPGLASWKLASGLVTAHTDSSDTMAWGGNLAYWDGVHGNLKGMDLSAAASSVGDASFAHEAQLIGSWTVASQGGNALA